MREQCVRRKDNSRNRILLMFTELNFRIHIRQIKEATVKYSLSDISVSAAISPLKSSFSLLILPHPFPEFCDHLLLLFENLNRLTLIDNADFGFRIGIVVYGNSFHIEDILKQVKHIHSMCTVNGIVILLVLAVLMALAESRFLGNLPNTGYVIVSYRVLRLQERLRFFGIFIIHLFDADQMKNKIVNDIGRNPRRTKRNVDFIGFKLGSGQLFECFNVAIKDSGILIVCRLCDSKLVHQVAGKIFVRCFPALVIALSPV